MAKYDYILLDGTSISDTDEEKNPNEYVLKTSHSPITTTSHLNDPEILNTIIARGKNPVGGVDVARNFPLDYDLTQYPLYRHSRGDGTSGQVLDSSGFDEAYEGFGTYLASSAMINLTGGYAAVLDISIQKVLLDVSIDNISVGSGTAKQPKVNTFYMAYNSDNYKNASHEYDISTGFLGRYAENSSSPLKYSLSSINEFRTGLKVYWDSFVVVPLGISGINHSYVSEYNINGYGHSTALPRYAIYSGNTFPRESFNEAVGNILFRYNTDGYTSAFYITTEEDSLFLIACLGFAFRYNGTIYKPIVNGGIVTGYTDDLDSESEWDNWKNIGDHAFPDNPNTPLPPAPVDGFSPNEYRTSGDVNGLGRFYLMSGTNLDALSDAIKSAPLGFDLRNSLISCYSIPNDGGLVDAPIPSTIKFRLGGVGVDRIEVWDTQVNANRIIGSTQGKILGRVQIPRPTDTFLDFEPYTTLELYVPFCGWCSLPPSLCVGKEIVVKLYTNVPLCSCRVVVEVGGCAVAHMQGVWGSMVPFTSDGSAIKNAEVTKNVIDVLGSAIVGVAGAATGSEMAIAAGITGAIGSATQAGLNSRKNYGYYVGSSGDSTTFNMGNRCWYKLVYPEPDIPSSYGHVVGYICNKTMGITNGMGFTIIDDPRINVNCTDVERDELRELLLKGVIF